MVAFDRFLARLVRERLRIWVIKGGFALQLRLRERARTTRDIDAAITREVGREEITRILRRAAAKNLGDWFDFEVQEPSEVATGAPRGGWRFPIRCLLDGRVFEMFHLDVGQGDPVPGAPERLTGPRLLDFAGVSPARVPCYPLSAQIAEKLHAYTRPYRGGGSSRVRDLADIVLIASLGSLLKKELERALRETFEPRTTHPLPRGFPKPPSRWVAPYRKLAKELGLGWTAINTAGRAAARFLNPVLQGTAGSRWTPADWRWK